jgi:hypothetical protein
VKEIISVLAGILSIVSYIPYILAILRKQTKPAKASWIIWACLDTIVFAGMISAKTVNGQMMGVVAGVWIIAALSLKYGIPGWTRLDKICLCGAGIGIAVWQIFSSPVLGIVISLGMNCVGSIPTFVSAWKDPSRENKLAWTMAFVVSAITVVIIPRWTLADASQPFVFLALQTVIMYLLYIRPRSLIASEG